MPPEPDINALARQAQKGDVVAFEQLARALTPLLMAFFQRKGGGDAEELTQQTWLQVTSGLASYDCNRDFKTWLFSIAFYRWVDEQRRVNPEPIVKDIPASSMDDPVSGEEFAAALHDCIQRLPETERFIIFLRYWEELDLNGVAERINQPYMSVKGKVYRARRNLAKCLKEKFS